MTFVVDTHALVWFLEGSEKLSRAARQILSSQAEHLVVPTIVLAEVKHLAARGRIRSSWREVMEAVESDPRCVVYPLDASVVELMPAGLEIHDAIICGTALLYRDVLGTDVQVVTTDGEIRASGVVETVW